MKKNIITLALPILFIMLVGCNKKVKRDADLDGIDLTVKIERFDSAFWNIDTTDIAGGISEVHKKYPGITDVYLENVVRFGHPDSSITHYTYRLFRRDTAVKRIYNDCLATYSDLKDYDAQLTDAFRRGKYFFPHLATPLLYCHVSGFNQSVVIGDGFLSISLDNYLGSDYPIYDSIGIYDYQLTNMTPKHVVPDYIIAWLSSEYYPQPQSNLLDDIIYRGKILYAASCLLPHLPDNVIMGYTAEQWQWMEEREKDIWNIILSNRVLYETNMLTKGQYLNDGPFTLPFSQESPSRGGVYLGWKIIQKYMSSNQSVSLRQLMDQTDSQTILSKSNYRP